MNTERKAWVSGVEPQGSFIVTTLKLALPKLPPAFHNYRFVQLTDLHLGTYTPLRLVEEAAQVAKSLTPDILLLTGDYIHLGLMAPRLLALKIGGRKLAQWSPYRRRIRAHCLELGSLITSIAPKTGTIGTWGNHDHLEGIWTIRRNLPSSVVWLENSATVLSKDGQKISIGGLDDITRGDPQVAATLSALNAEPKSVARILLSHNPDITQLASEASFSTVDVILSGHTHGGQICLPGSKPIITQTKQRKHTKGLSHFGSTPIYVSNGIGHSGIPLRVFCKPEIVVLELLAAD